MVDYGRWQYGTAGDEFPVEPGDIWKVGRHHIACADIEDTLAHDWIYDVGPPEVVYVDPPWDKGNARAFRTKAAVGRDVDFEKFLETLIGLIRVSKHAYIEMGQRNIDLLGSVVRNGGGRVVDILPTKYYRTKPALLMLVSFNGSDLPVGVSRVSEMWDRLIPSNLLNLYTEPLIIGDPCTGTGVTTMACEEHGHTFIGTELHPRRLAVGIKNLVHVHGLEAAKVGEWR